MNAYPWLEIHRTVRFSDSDAAGVMHFQSNQLAKADSALA